MAYPSFPDLSRKPALQTKRSFARDPTLRDDLANGMEQTRAEFTRSRRQYSVTFEHLTGDDLDALDYFIEQVAVYGANIFLFRDERNAASPKTLTVRFSKLPEDSDEGWVADQFRQKFAFELREV